MEIGNETGEDTDYKVSNGGTREGEWATLPAGTRARCRAYLPGPWKIRFRIKGKTYLGMAKKSTDSVVLKRGKDGHQVAVSATPVKPSAKLSGLKPPRKRSKGPKTAEQQQPNG